MQTLLTRKVTNETMTRAFAQKLYKSYLQDSDNFTIFVEGGLGAGKTFLIRALLEIFGVEEEVTSPTYTYVQEYEAGGKQFAHFDLYRTKNSADFVARGFADIADDRSVNKLVEWPQRLGAESFGLFSGDIYTVVIDHGIGASMRQIKLLKK